MIVGLGPGPAEWMTPEAGAAIEAATDVVGYGPYLERLTLRPDQRVHASDNRLERDRARLALALAAEGCAVAVVSGGDPGVFAMASAVFEAIDVRPVADDIGCGLDRRARLGRHPLRGPGTEPDDHEAPAHGRRPLPGARMSEK